MVRSYREITPQLARQIKLVMADVDGTMTASDDSISAVASEAARQLEKAGITVGLVSGRTIYGLEALAKKLGISGPIIAENGAVAKLKVSDELVNLGYSRQPALNALEKLKKIFPGAIKEREDNRERLVDVVFWALGIDKAKLLKHLEDVELLDSGFILHLMLRGISKGKTLLSLLGQIREGSLSPDEVMVFGDSTTDISLFELFPHSVLIINPRLPAKERRLLEKAAEYASDLPFGDGFAEVARYIIAARRGYKEAPKS